MPASWWRWYFSCEFCLVKKVNSSCPINLHIIQLDVCPSPSQKWTLPVLGPERRMIPQGQRIEMNALWLQCMRRLGWKKVGVRGATHFVLLIQSFGNIIRYITLNHNLFAPFWCLGHSWTASNFPPKVFGCLLESNFYRKNAKRKA